MGEKKPSIHDQLPAYPTDIYPDWKPTDAAYETQDYCDYAPQLSDPFSGEGLLSLYNRRDSMPDEAEHFVRQQFQRFGIEQPPLELMYYSWWQTYYYVDAIDPYVFFYGCCDVIKTEENYYYQYSVCNDNFENWREIEPGTGETFKYWKKGEEAWETLMDYPGLDEYFDDFSDYFGEHFDCVMADDHPESYADEWEFINRWGKKGAYDRVHLALWASIMWMMSPMAKAWRTEKHPIFGIVYEYDACLVHDWCFHSPEYYHVDNRPAMTCAVCGVSEWCVELIHSVDHETKFICEHCLNPVKTVGASCGKRSCTKHSCAHHEGIGAAKQIAADERYGPLRQLPGGQKARELPGMMYINEKAVDQLSMGIADSMGEDLKKLLTF